ncbi:hypothetical protein LSH36_272g06050 [Paralvinella palmiformis]|uniref:AAA+ ATPase domain-containing protein n=1 Tax=Paralvinella palmiformis TaxID=53620 RepID=A0AAD9N4T0_9ANNE|nr:hypothetical protein LSH36_272g06050 [Paralvinella palmiformis]
MYRKYKGKFTSRGLRPFSAVAFLSDTESLSSLSRPVSAMSLSNVNLSLESDNGNVAHLWRIIEQQCWKYENSSHHSQTTSCIGNSGHEWKTIRIFVSSTFTDFYSEREILVKKIFPELREWCECRKLHLVECDLRWGIPNDLSSSAAIATCLSELDRCNEETDGEPFFINMLSERYGWIPSAEDLTEDLQESYDWIPGVSITHMEILHGAYRIKNPNAIFLIRDPSFLDSVPDDKRKRFVDEDDLAKEHLKVLKRKLGQNFSQDQVKLYNCHYDSLEESTGRKKVVLGGLDGFAKTVLEFFQDAISRKYPNRYNIESLSQLDQEENAHLRMMEVMTKYVQQLNDEVAAMMKFAKEREVNGFKAMTDAVHNLMELQGVNEKDIPPLCIIGETGSGKSTLAALFAKTAIKEGLNVLYHCVGSTSASSTDTKILGRIILALRDQDHPDKSALPEDIQSLHCLLKEQFQEWRGSQKRLVIVVDGINKADDAETFSYMSWLPVRFPRNIRCILTTNSSHLPSMARLTSRQVLTIAVQPLSEDLQKDIVENFFRTSNKKLDKEQLTALMHKKCASHPLWLILACEELRVFGDFRMLTRKIRSLPDGLGPLLTDILNRLLQMDKEGYLSKVLRLIYCSPDGIPESELPRLLSDSDDHEPIPLLSWATARRELKIFTNSVTYGYNGVQMISFKYGAMMQAAKSIFELQVKIRGCFCHLIQSTWTIVQNLSLVDLCHEEQEVKHLCVIVDSLVLPSLDDVLEDLV